MTSPPPPVVYKKQKQIDTTCVYCCYCNYFSLDITEQTFKEEFVTYWKQLPSISKLKPTNISNRLSHYIGNGGYTPDVLKTQLRRINQKFHEVYNLKDTFHSELSLLRNAFIVLYIRDKYEFYHMICIKGGFLIDSIDGRVYPWRGIIMGYNKYEFVSYLDLRDD